ncbi:enoyl-CoA hydratase/isomerase family protein [Pseudonocardia sp. WMMC193]|uniref:enoyl-CoA hydratase/isomerase family protein n=1 Tax=Pseudonocardia sp. WMMC193 TaxID=2911965 RepID=UPI001F3B8D04|nr:enoyl-CoA hydratase/isomerase family protein [Pseudonocardia sp. WMMC193]MCF7549870.1 enoyl-CoA hydratase/isomerase family protein [Pseudonocardia sp. WMMC193]
MTVPVLAPAELAELPPLLDGDGGIVHPLVAVDLDGPGDSVPAGDRILVGIGTPRALCADLDLTLVTTATDRTQVAVADPAAALAHLDAVVAANPQASTVLAGLLRWSGTLDVPAALDAESLAYSTLLGGPEFGRWLAARGPRPLPPPVADPVLAAREGGTLHLTLNRPERRNAYGRLLRDALVGLLDLALLDPTVERVVLDGTGPAFCAGGDLDEFGTTPDPVTAHLVRTRAGAALPLHALRGRVEVRLHGACVGAGIELPAYAGRVVADPDTVLRLPEVAMGLIPGAGGTVSIPRRIGRHRALWCALSGLPVPAATALEWGLVDAIVPARARLSP